MKPKFCIFSIINKTMDKIAEIIRNRTCTDSCASGRIHGALLYTTSIYYDHLDIDSNPRLECNVCTLSRMLCDDVDVIDLSYNVKLKKCNSLKTSITCGRCIENTCVDKIIHEKYCIGCMSKISYKHYLLKNCDSSDDELIALKMYNSLSKEEIETRENELHSKYKSIYAQ